MASTFAEEGGGVQCRQGDERNGSKKCTRDELMKMSLRIPCKEHRMNPRKSSKWEKSDKRGRERAHDIELAREK
jgi:hypothetical protein